MEGLGKRHLRNLRKREKEKMHEESMQRKLSKKCPPLKQCNVSKESPNNAGFLVNSEANCDEISNCFYVDDSSSFCSRDRSSSESDTSAVSWEEKMRLQDKLSNWYRKHLPGKKCFDELLEILFSEGIDIPRSANSLIKFNKKIETRCVEPGVYFHNGIGHHVESLKNNIERYNVQELLLDLNIDGLPLFKSSNTVLWPILGHFFNIPCSDVFLIGTYLGQGKPENVNTYLQDLINEINKINVSGIQLNKINLRIKIRAFICDAPARSFLCQIVGHNSYYGCSKCEQVGIRVENTTTFLPISGHLRTDESFFTRKDLLHHHFSNEKSILETNGIKMVTQFPLDPMHLLD